MALHARWTKILDAEILQRSSQAASVINNQLYVYGGELRPREPRDNAVHVVSMDGEASTASLNSVTAHDNAPSPRVGTATATIKDSLYLFSGRGGVAMSPVDEEGAIWKFDTHSRQWTLLPPADAAKKPQARSYHCMTSNQEDTLYIHAGCPEKGRLSDLWSFNINTRQCKELAPAPGPARGGASITYAAGKLYRMNGFDGTTEQGGSLDIYNPESNAWTTLSYQPDNERGPIARSVCALLPVNVAGKSYIITLFGESDPSNLGHQGAGKMLADVWAFDIVDHTWLKVDTQGELTPDARGWFAADVASDGKNENKIIVQGGLGEANNRLGDVWILQFA